MTQTASAEAAPDPTLPERLTRPEVLRQWLAGVDQRLDRMPGDRALRLRRAELLRALGALAAACDAYAALAADGDAAAQRAHAILAGGALPPGPVQGAVPFVRLHGVLAPEQREHIWEAISDPHAEVRDALVGPNCHDPSIRRARLVGGTGAVTAWFLPWLVAVMEREGVLDRLGLAPFEAGRRELQITGHAGGGFYRMHRDTDPTKPTRHVTFLYYIHRTPRRFAGGDLLLFDETAAGTRQDAIAFTRLDPTDDSLVLFPSDRLHAVTPVSCDSADPLDGRWTVNGWLHRAADTRP